MMNQREMILNEKDPFFFETTTKKEKAECM